MNQADVTSYLSEASEIEGSVLPVDAYALAMFDEIQKRQHMSGNLFELGGHFGKMAVLLARLAAPDESVGVCDVLEDGGERFAENLRSLSTLPAERLSVFSKRSALLTADETSNRCRIFQIEGGYSPEDVFTDLVSADRALLADGVVSLSDIFNPNQPGVSEGFYNFIATRPDAFVPLLIGGSIVFFTRPDAAEAYERHWADEESRSQFFDPGIFRFDFREWLGRRVLTAIRTAGQEGSWTNRIRRALRRQ